MANPPTCTFKNGKYLVITIDDSRNTCDEVIETTKTFPTKSTSTNVYILTSYLLITIALLTAVSIYSYLIKYQGKEKYLLPYYVTNN